MQSAIEHADTNVVVVGLPNDMQKEAIALCAAAGKVVLCTTPLGRSAAEAKLLG